MKYSAAKKLLSVNIECLSIEALQKHKVKLLDAWRDSTATYGIEQAVRDGYYLSLASESANGHVPKDIWLSHNLSHCIDLAIERERVMLTE